MSLKLFHDFHSNDIASKVKCKDPNILSSLYCVRNSERVTCNYLGRDQSSTGFQVI